MTFAVVIPHLGLGDQVCLNGAVRYLSKIHDRVKLVALDGHFSNISAMYADLSNLDIIRIDSDPRKVQGESLESRIERCYGSNAVPYVLGVHRETGHHSLYYFPYCFYSDMNLSLDTFWSGFYIPDRIESTYLYEQILMSSGGRGYAFIHNTSSSGNLFEIQSIERQFNFSIFDILTLGATVNFYPKGHRWYDVSELVRRSLIIDLRSVIENANIVVLSDSSLYCLSLHLFIKTKHTYYVRRPGLEFVDIYAVEAPESLRPLLPRFRLLNQGNPSLG